MSYQNIAKAKAIEKKNKERWLGVNSKLDDNSGIYFLTREDENGIKYAYIGQAKHIISRLAQHLDGYQHIDLSLKKHGLYSIENPNGWRVGFLHCSVMDLDDLEKDYIKMYANHGYPQKGYRDGIQQGRKALARELRHIIDKHLVVSLKPEKSANKVSQNALDKFNYLLDENNYKTEKKE